MAHFVLSTTPSLKQDMTTHTDRSNKTCSLNMESDVLSLLYLTSTQSLHYPVILIICGYNSALTCQHQGQVMSQPTACHD